MRKKRYKGGDETKINKWFFSTSAVPSNIVFYKVVTYAMIEYLMHYIYLAFVDTSKEILYCIITRPFTKWQNWYRLHYSFQIRARLHLQITPLTKQISICSRKRNLSPIKGIPTPHQAHNQNRQHYIHSTKARRVSRVLLWFQIPILMLFIILFILLLEYSIFSTQLLSSSQEKPVLAWQNWTNFQRGLLLSLTFS